MFGYGRGGPAQGNRMYDREQPKAYPGSGGGHWGGGGGYGGGGFSGGHRGPFGDRMFKVCNSWRQTGKCNYGDRCKFYHEGTGTPPTPISGQFPPREIPTPPPSLPDSPVMHQEKSGNSGQMQGFHSNSAHGTFSDGGRGGGGRWDRERDRETLREGPFFKTKLCDKYQQLGHCPYEDRCTFAHGMDELRPFPRQLSESHMGQPGTANTPGAGDPYNANSGHVSSSHAPSASLQHPVQSTPPPQMTVGNSTHTQGAATPKVVDITLLDRVRAVCRMLSIGDAGSLEEKPGTSQAAMAAIRNGVALKENLYADSVEAYVPTQKT